MIFPRIGMHRQPPRPRASVYCTACHHRYRRTWRASTHRGYGWGLCRRCDRLPQPVLPRST